MSAEIGSTQAEPDGDLRRRAVNGVVWTTVEKWSVRLSTLVGFVILGNLLSPLEFGVVALAMTFINFLTTIADAGFATYLVQKRELTRAIMHTAFWTTTAMALALAATLAGIAGPLSRVLDVPELRSVLPALALSLFIAGLSVVPAALLGRELRFKELAVRQIAAVVPSIIVAVALAFAGAGVWALVAQTLVRSVVSSIVLWVSSDYRPRWVFDRSEVGAMTRFGTQSLLINLQIQLRAQGELFIIGALAGAVTLGYWTVAGRLVGVVVDVFSSVVGRVAHPVFARLQDAPDRLARALGSTRALSALVLVPGLVLLALVSEDVVPAVFGEQWTPTTTVASLLALSAVFQSMSNFDRSALMATGHPGAELAVTSAFIVLQLAVAFVFHDRLELLAAGMLVTMALSVPVRLLVVRRLLSVPLSAFRGSLTVLLAGGVSTAAVLGADAALGLDGWRYVVLATGLGAVVYTLAVLVLARPVAAEAVGIARGVLARRSRAGTT